MSVAATPPPTKAVPAVLATMTRNSLANLLRVGSSWLIVLFLPPLLVRVMDKPSYAVWLLLLQLAAYITFFDSGIQIAIARYVARSDALGERDRLARLLSNAAIILLVAALVTILLTAIVSWHLIRFFPAIPPDIASGASKSLLVIGTSLSLTLPFTLFAGFFLGRQRNGVTAIAGSVGKFAGALGAAWAAFHHHGLLAMALFIALGNLLQSAIYFGFWNHRDHRGLLQLTQVDRAVAREFFLFCSATLVSQFSSLLITGLDMPIVAAFDFRAAAYYGVASILSNALVVPHGAIVSSLLPVAAGISAQENPVHMGHVLLKTTRIATILLCLGTTPLLLLMPFFLHVWVGPDYATHTLLLGEILVAAQFIRLTMFPYAMVGFAAGQQHRMLISPITEGIVNVLLSLVLVRFIGAPGVAIGTLIGAIVGVTLHLTLSLRRTDSIRQAPSQLLLQGVLKPVAISLPFMLCALLTQRIVSSSIQLMLAASAELALFTLLWHLCLSSIERAQFRGLLHL